jgi:acyl-CoA thioester hydrolase
MSGPFVWPVRVYWEDTDGGGIVYHANYVRFLERARTEWLRGLGFNQSALQRSSKVVFAVYAMQLKFMKPARLDDTLDISVEQLRLRRASFTVSQRIVDARDGALLCAADAEIACLDSERFRPIPIPNDIYVEMAKL